MNTRRRETDVNGVGVEVPTAGATLLEREAELGIIDELLDELPEGVGRALLIEGPAGVGKSSLLWVAVEKGRTAGARTLVARASEFERDYAFGIVCQLFEPLVRGILGEERRALFAGPAALAEPILSGAARSNAMSVADARYGALHALYWLTIHLSEREPLLLAVDDVQWSDGPSLRFLSFLERRLEGVRTLMVFAARSGERPADADSLESLMTSGRAHHARPALLGAAAVENLIRVELARAPEPGLVDVLHGATRGNPYFLREMLAALRAEGGRPTAADAERLIESGPPGLSRMILRRVGQLTPPEVALAEAVAVLGTDARPPIAAAVAGLDEREAEAATLGLVEAELLSAGGRLDLVHPLIRSAIRTSLVPARRAEMQADAARRLTDEGMIEAAAEHLLDLAPGSQTWVAEVLAEAADAAVSRGAPEVALTLWQRALQEPPAPAQEAALLLATGAVESELGRPGAVEHLRRALDVAAGPGARAGAARELAAALLRVGDTKGMADVLDQVAAEVAPVDRHLAEELEAQLLLFGPWDLALAPDLIPRLGRLAAPGPGATAQPVRMSLVAIAALHEIRPAVEVAAAAESALRSGALVARQTWMAAAGFVAANILAIAGRPEEALDHIERAMTRDRARMAVGAVRTGLGVRARVALMRGDALAAEAELRALFDLAQEGELGPPGLLDLLIEVLIERGRLDEAEEQLELAGFDGDLPRFSPLNSLMCARGRLLVARGRLDLGIAELLACGERCEIAAGGPGNPAIVRWRSEAALALAATGDSEQALALAEEEVRLAAQFGAAHVEGPALRVLGVVSEGPAGLALLRQAVTTLEPSFARLELAKALGDLGSVLAADGEGAEARSTFGRGLELAQRLGADVLAVGLLDDLVAVGGRPRSRSRRGVEGLTPSERRVAELAAGGLTNRLIAQELFLSEKTIETHLASTYRKLEIRSRAQLTGVLGSGEEQPAG
jgi:DNA-binding CsgD family transcriptional regulator